MGLTLLVPRGFALLVADFELELIQPHMAQKPVLRGEVGCACVAREVSAILGAVLLPSSK